MTVTAGMTITFRSDGHPGAGRGPISITVDQLLQQTEQTPTLNALLWGPLCVSALNTPTSRADARTFVNVLQDALMRKGSDSDLLVPAIDLSALFPDAALAWLGERGCEIALGTRVQSLERDTEGWQIELQGGKTRRFDAVVCAVAPFQVASLVENVGELAALVVKLNTLEHEPIATVYMQYEASPKLPFPMVGPHRRPRSVALRSRGPLRHHAGWSRR